MEFLPSLKCGNLNSELSLPADSTTIGLSVMRREIRAWRTGGINQSPILVVAGQHGDETCGILAAAKIIRFYAEKCSGNESAVWIIPCLNPDAMAECRRLNADRVDLNRDHLARVSPEVRSLHRFIRHIKPCCVLDLHCFPARRRWMKELNVEHAADVLFDWATGPAELLLRNSYTIRLSSIKRWLQEESSEPLHAARYWLRSGGGRIRHSTPDWLDLRNQVAACYRIPTYLIEGREPLGHEPWQVNRTVDAMFLAVTRILASFQSREAKRADRGRTGGVVCPTFMPTKFRYQTREPIQISLRDRISHEAYLEPIGKKHSDRTLPYGYVRVAETMWIPKSLSGVIAHLRRLDAPVEDGADWVKKNALSPVETVQFRFASRQPSEKAMRNERRTQIEQTNILLEEPAQFFVLSSTPEGRVFWNSLLDPRHKFSICRMHQQELFSPVDDRYPILFQYVPHESDTGRK